MHGLPLSSEVVKTTWKAVPSSRPWHRLKILSQGQILEPVYQCSQCSMSLSPWLSSLSFALGLSLEYQGVELRAQLQVKILCVILRPEHRQYKALPSTLCGNKLPSVLGLVHSHALKSCISWELWSRTQPQTNVLKCIAAFLAQAPLFRSLLIRGYYWVTFLHLDLGWEGGREQL